MMIKTKIKSFFFYLSFFFCLPSLFAQISNPEEEYSKKLAFVFEKINKNYVDDVDAQKLVVNAVEGIVSSFDSSTAYQFANDLKSDSAFKMYFDELGVDFSMISDTLVTAIQTDGAFKVDDLNYSSKKLGQLASLLNIKYDHQTEIDIFVEPGIDLMLEKLDPHSIYIPKKEMMGMNAPLKGDFEGVGIRFQILKDTLMVVNPIPGGPSEKVGIRAGDKIIYVEDQLIAGTGIKTGDVRDLLLGKKGTKVNVRILRSRKRMLDFSIIRDKIPIHSLDAAYMVNDRIGYIKLNNFSQRTISEYKAAIDTLKKQGMESLILDLQGNGGGYLKTAVNLTDEFISGHRMVVYTKSRYYKNAEYKTKREGNFENGKLVVLINRSSASASEIVSGAIQDWDRGVIVGRRSFGKGLVQRPVNLPDQSQIRLTTSRYYTPSGRSIQKSYDAGKANYKREKYDRLTTGELLHADSIKFNDSLKFKTLIKQREVYGGGGIMPDIFVPLDTTKSSELLTELLSNGILNTFPLEYVDKNRKKILSKFKNATSLKNNFVVDEEIENLFFNYAKKEGVERNNEQYEISKELIHSRIKAGIAYNIWGTEALYMILNELNPIYTKAIDILENSTYESINISNY